jgi:hypothetical protein
VPKRGHTIVGYVKQGKPYFKDLGSQEFNSIPLATMQAREASHRRLECDEYKKHEASPSNEQWDYKAVMAASAPNRGNSIQQLVLLLGKGRSHHPML